MTGPMYHFILIIFASCSICRIFSPFFCRPSMPPKRSQRLRNPSAQAVAIAAVGEPPRKRSRRTAMQSSTETDCQSPTDANSQPSTQTITQAVASQPLSLPPGVLDQLVTRVADEVTRRLSPPETPVNSNSVPSALSEVPLGSTQML